MKLKTIDFSSLANKPLKLRIIKTIMLLGRISPPENEKNDYYRWTQAMIDTPFQNIPGGDSFDFQKTETFFNFVKGVKQEEIDTIVKDVNEIITRISDEHRQHSQGITEIERRFKNLFVGARKISKEPITKQHEVNAEDRMYKLSRTTEHEKELVDLVLRVNRETNGALDIRQLYLQKGASINPALLP